MPAIGPLLIENDPNTGQVSNISTSGLPALLNIHWDQENHTLPPPVQLSGITGDLNLIPTPGGPNIDSITLLGPANIGAQAVYANNAGGSTDSTLNVGDTAHANLLQGFAARGLESLTVTGPETVQMKWGADGQGPSSSVGVDQSNVPHTNLDLLHGPGGGNLSSIQTGGLLNSQFIWGDNPNPASGPTFPIQAGQDPTNLSLLAHLNDRTLQHASVEGTTIVDHSSGDHGGATAGGLLGAMDITHSLGDLGHLDHILG